MSRHRSRTRSQRDDKQANDELREAVGRLETAAEDLLKSAKGRLSERTANFIDETTSLLERELRGGSPSSSRSRGDRGRSRSRFRRRVYGRRRHGKIYRDRSGHKIAGVCAGIANYYGLDTWLVRCIALTGLVMVPTVIFPAYWIAYFVFGEDPDAVKKTKKASSRASAQSPSGLSPRRGLRNAHADLSEVELRLRRLEKHVTSNQFELEREFNRLDDSNLGRGNTPGLASK